MSENATQRQAELVMHYVEGWLSNDYPEAAAYLREHLVEIAEQMVEDECAEPNLHTARPPHPNTMAGR